MLILDTKIRQEKSNVLRRDGQVPAVVYGPKTKSQNLTMLDFEFKKVFSQAGESELISLKIPMQEKSLPVLIHEIQKDPLNGGVTHVDFYAPDLTKTVQVSIPLSFEGVSAAVKDLNGMLVRSIQEIEIEAMPTHLPREIKVDISKLVTFEEKILISDLVLPEGVRVMANLEEVVALVIPPRSEEELAALEQVSEEKVEEVEVVNKKPEDAESEESK